MSDTPEIKDGADSKQSARRARDQSAEPGQRKRRAWRVVLLSLGSFLTLALAASIGIYVYVNHTVSSIPRVHVGHLVGTGTGSSGETFLIAGSPWEPTGTAVQGVPASYSKLIMLLHINANGRAGGVVAIPGDALVHVPGVGTKPLWYALKAGGPSLLVQTVSQVTGVPINHYAEIDLNHLTDLVDAIGGVDVTLSAGSASSGHTFVPGVNHLTGITAIYYARDPSLSDGVAILRQEDLLRAILIKIANDHLLTNPITALRVLNAITSTLTVDSNMSNSQVESLARKLGTLGANAATFVTAPTRTVNGELVLNAPVASQLWTTIKKNSIAKFATTFPAAVTPEVVP
jgi:polyisoprenyl-teichoic acid--peptidoglycan teichoic acid transferase